MNDLQRCHTKLNNLATNTLIFHLHMASTVEKLTEMEVEWYLPDIKGGYRKMVLRNTKFQFCKISF